MDLLQNLNKEQKEAVTATEGHIRVIAGAGSGKTKTLSHRYAYLVNKLGISVSNILCVTFTNKAASEMRKRIRSMIGDIGNGYICTFHGMGVSILREDIHAINYPNGFVIMDTEDVECVLKKIYSDLNITSKNVTFKEAQKYIHCAKTTPNKNGVFQHIPHLMRTDNTQLKNEYADEKNILKKIYLGYLYEQKKNYALDYDDLITIPLYILMTDNEKRRKWQERMLYVMVDEFQDVSRLNYVLAIVLSDYHKNLFVVGDPNQTIYSWRGAKLEFLLNFDKQFPDAKTIKLYKNYRSTPMILGAANSLISKNTPTIPNELVSMQDNGALNIYGHFRNTKDEAGWIAKKIKELLENGVKYSAIAILYRAHFVSRSVEEALLKEKIPYVLYSGIEFYKRKEIKDILSYMRMVAFADDLSFRRVVNEPKRNIGKKRMSFLEEYAEKNNCSLYEALKTSLDDPLFKNTKAESFVNTIEKYKEVYKEMQLSDIFTGILNDSGYESMLRTIEDDDRLNNLSELKTSIYDFEMTSGEESLLEDYLQSISLYTNSDKDNRKDSVKLMTVHIAKGLEFPYVFVCGLNEQIFPSKNAKEFDELEEERRIAYVAITRAENALFLTDAEGVNYDGSFRYPSRFIFDIGREYLQYETELEESLIENTNKIIKHSENMIGNAKAMLKSGDKIIYEFFGKGEITNVTKNLYVVKFNDFKTERNLSFNAPLKKQND